MICPSLSTLSSSLVLIFELLKRVVGE